MHFREGEFDSQCCEKQSFACAENDEGQLKGLSFQQNELFGFFGCVLHRKGFLSVEFQRLFSFSLIWRVFFHCNGFLSIQSVYLESTGFLCPMSFIQRFSLESAKLVLTAFKGFSKHATKVFFFLALNRFPMPSSYIRRVLLLQCDALAMFLNNFSC